MSRVNPRKRVRTLFFMQMFALLLIVLFIPVALFAVQKHHPTKAKAASTIFPYVKGNQIFDGSGNLLILRGGHIQSKLNVKYPDYTTPNDILATQHLNRATFDVMYNDWGMNVVRIGTSDWLWQAHPGVYIATLQKVVADANASGLYVVLSLHEDMRAGLPSTMNEHGMQMPTPEALIYWKAVAKAFKNNPMVMFDIFNEPHQPNLNRYLLTDANWQFWLHGGTYQGFTALGMQDLVNGIRQSGAKQIVIVQGLQNWFQTIDASHSGANFVQDPNVVYSVHQYFQDDVRTTASWDAKFGTLSSTHPIFVGEWAFEVNSPYPSRCDNLTPDQAAALVQSFIAYIEQHGVSWAAYAFTNNQLFLDSSYTTYTPTQLNAPNETWTCADPNAKAGDGFIIQQYLLSVSPHLRSR